ncbi:MAG: SpoIIE family protein phosphatase [Acidobacteria bacterium]|nr:SpoIIE family protein phosphatase [Acidobacteriota bacterium]
MPIPPKLKTVYRRLGWVDIAFVALVAVYSALLFVAPRSGWRLLVQFLAVAFGLWIGTRLIRLGVKRAIWRLRNRLVVTYLFIAVVPVLLIVTLAGLALWMLTTQIAVYLVTGELDRRIASLQMATDAILNSDTPSRVAVMQRMAEIAYKDRFPGIEMMLRTRNGIDRFPADGTFPPPPEGWGAISGLMVRGGHFYAWSHGKTFDGDFTIVAPLSREYLANLVPNLGVVQLVVIRNDAAKGFRLDRDSDYRDDSDPASGSLPPKANRFDVEVDWPAEVPVEVWESPGAELNAWLYVRSRPSAVYGAFFTRKAETMRGDLPSALVAIAIAFLVVELMSLVAGISLTRSITLAIHHLYEGTRRVMHGDFSHRIEVRGKDQLADLSNSFNLMTERIENLLVVAKEKERLQSEIEIAREVQNQLYPKKAPEVRTLRLTAVCKPARMVSGDYFDYECVRDSKLALAIGDVAGKGISAALLMATLQSSLRTELRGAFDGGGPVAIPSTAELVSHLNRQLYAYTSPEKYATFYLGIYDEIEGVLRYTNAGHLPPILVRNGQATRLNVDGTVVGAFPFAQYDESRIQLDSGDLLVCFTDGVSEPENEYGEMFGEERLVELVTRNVHRGDDQIVASVIEAVEQWTGSPELQDDMTLLLARRN